MTIARLIIVAISIVAAVSSFWQDANHPHSIDAYIGWTWVFILACWFWALSTARIRVIWKVVGVLPILFAYLSCALGFNPVVSG